MTEEDKFKDTLAIEFYKTARTELIERIKQRDQIVSFYFSALTFIFGAGIFSMFTKSGNKSIISIIFGDNTGIITSILKDKELSEISFIISFILLLISLSLCLKVTQHDILIGKLSDYCTKELFQYSNVKIPVQWDNSENLSKYYLGISGIVFLSNFILFSIPSLIGMYISYYYIENCNFFYLNLLFLVLNLIILGIVFYLRNKNSPNQVINNIIGQNKINSEIEKPIEEINSIFNRKNQEIEQLKKELNLEKNKN